MAVVYPQPMLCCSGLYGVKCILHLRSKSLATHVPHARAPVYMLVILLGFASDIVWPPPPPSSMCNIASQILLARGINFFNMEYASCYLKTHILSIFDTSHLYFSTPQVCLDVRTPCQLTRLPKATSCLLIDAQSPESFVESSRSLMLLMLHKFAQLLLLCVYIYEYMLSRAVRRCAVKMQKAEHLSRKTN